MSKHTTTPVADQEAVDQDAVDQEALDQDVVDQEALDQDSVGAGAGAEAAGEAPAEPEPAAPEQETGTSEADVAELVAPAIVPSAAELEAAQRDAAAQRDEALRLRAEMENLRRRSAREVENAHKYGVERLVGELLPVKDSMELGLKATSEAGAAMDSVREGMDLTLKMFVAALEKFGLREVDPLGQPFDPEFHQAMSTQPTEDAEPDTVVMVFQKGYVLSDRLVRPAMVVVAKRPD